MNNVRALARKLWQTAQQLLLQLLFPRRCPVCDGIVRPFGAKICPECRKKWRPVSEPWCMKCGKKLRARQELCADCRSRTHVFERGRALYEYRDVAPAIYRMKYGGRREYAEFFGEEAARRLADFVRQVQPDVLVPIPLHRKRMRKRGYNQAALIAKAMGKALGVPVREKMLLRIKNTAPLKAQNPEERQNNLKKAFIIDQNDVKLKTILLVDDIYTTGSTMDEAARVCRAAGAAHVYFVTVACGVSS